MNILLCCFDQNKEENNNLDILLCNYQDYFLFEKKNNQVYLYLRVDILKKYLQEGIEIKYKKFIFLFLENISNIKENKSYFFEKLPNYHQYHLFFQKHFDPCYRKYFNNKELDFQRSIFLLQKRYQEQKNKVFIKDKNIICLDENFYIDLNYGRYYLHNYVPQKNSFCYKGLIINQFSQLKNQLSVLSTIQTLEYQHKLHKKKDLYNYPQFFYQNKFHLPTQCTLIISEKNYFNTWLKSISKIYPHINQNKDIKLINNYNSLKNITNNDIQQLRFLIINVSILSTLNKKYLNNYSSCNSHELISYILYEHSYNKNIIYNHFEHLFLFHWENLIIDSLDYFFKIEHNLFQNLLSKHATYFISNEKISDQLNNLLIKQIIYNYDIHEYNFHYFLKKELMIQNLDDKNFIEKVELIEFQLNEEENMVANQYKEIQDNVNIHNKELSLLFIKSFHDYFQSINVNNMESFFLQSSNNNTTLSLQSNNLLNTYDENQIQNLNNLTNKSENKLINKSNHIISFIENIKQKNQISCCICMDIIVHNKVCVLECGHYFCKKCILIHKMSKQEKSLCPICRKDFQVIYFIDENNDSNNNNSNNEMYISSSHYSEKLNKILETIYTNQIANNKKKIFIVSEYNEILSYLYDKIVMKKDVILYQNSKQLQNKDYTICLINMNQLLKNNPYILDQIIFLDIHEQNYDKFTKIKIKYDDYYFETKIIDYMIYYVKGFLYNPPIQTQ